MTENTTPKPTPRESMPDAASPDRADPSGKIGERGGEPSDYQASVDEALEETFPASDPISPSAGKPDRPPRATTGAVDPKDDGGKGGKGGKTPV